MTAKLTQSQGCTCAVCLQGAPAAQASVKASRSQHELDASNHQAPGKPHIMTAALSRAPSTHPSHVTFQLRTFLVGHGYSRRQILAC